MNTILLTILLTVLAVHLFNFILIIIVDGSSHELGWEPMLIMMSFTVSLLWFILVYPWLRLYWRHRDRKEEEKERRMREERQPKKDVK